MAAFAVSERVTNVVHAKGIAFAKTDDGLDVYIPRDVREAHDVSTRGQIVRLEVVQGPKNLIAKMPPIKSDVVWADWQVGERQVKIPDTMPSSPHTSRAPPSRS